MGTTSPSNMSHLFHVSDKFFCENDHLRAYFLETFPGLSCRASLPRCHREGLIMQDIRKKTCTPTAQPLKD